MRTPFLFFCFLLAGVHGANAEIAIRQPHGYFVMQQVGAQNVKDRKLASPVWTGIVIRVPWARLEPRRGEFDWTFLDEQAKRAARLGKKYILAVYTGNNAPRWLNVPLYMEAPYPWDETMLLAHGEMAAALGARYAGDDHLVGVELGGPTRGPSGSLEMMLAPGLTRQPGYSPQRVIDAWKRCIDQYAGAFPRCALISDGGIAPGGRDAAITRGVFDYLARMYPRQAHFSHCALKASTQEQAPHHQAVLSMARHGFPIGFEMIGPSVGGVDGEKGIVARFGGDFAQSLEIADRAGAQWLKVYQGDEFNISR